MANAKALVEVSGGMRTSGLAISLSGLNARDFDARHEV